MVVDMVGDLILDYLEWLEVDDGGGGLLLPVGLEDLGASFDTTDYLVVFSGDISTPGRSEIGIHLSYTVYHDSGRLEPGIASWIGQCHLDRLFSFLVNMLAYSRLDRWVLSSVVIKPEM